MAVVPVSSHMFTSLLLSWASMSPVPGACRGQGTPGLDFLGCRETWVPSCGHQGEGTFYLLLREVTKVFFFYIQQYLCQGIFSI